MLARMPYAVPVHQLIFLLAGSQTDCGSVVPVVFQNTGWIKSVTIAKAPQPMCRDTVKRGHRGATQWSSRLTLAKVSCRIDYEIMSL